MKALHFLPYLRAFEAVARIGSVRQAADELGLSPGAVSLQLRRLSETTGLTLLEKSGRNIRLTAAGRDFAQTVSHAIGNLAVAVENGAERQLENHRKKLTVALPPALAIAWMAGLLVQFADTRGLTDLTMRSCIRASDVLWDDVDLAIVYDNPPFDRLWWQVVSDVKLRTICSPLLFPRLEGSHRDRKLRDVTLLHEDDGREWTRWSAAARISLEGSRSVRVPSVAVAVASALQGQGIALVSDVLTRSYLQEGRLIQPFPTAIPASAGYYLLCPTEKAEEPLIQALAHQIAVHLRGD
ncbi:LysR substrate-binding domain-containing protein [Ensifer adhaerens]|uniref:LysR substrate-binding domain-containing protein n=1 Tax=Ensifer adhaerens TaxID=106592 RepID=UPI00069DE44F|nr:LysR substrate-binding domain-containing protein [Ensifer adhaerens]